ncbi:MAG: PAS domain S-box protein [Desulfobacter sp.]|nr:MAG: PAS domain S-box protein [Desulfobacter sp.]
MNFFSRLSLKNKIFVSCLGFTLIVSMLIALFTRALLISSLTGELKERGVGIAQGTADSSRVFILTRNRAELTGLAYDARLGNRRDVVVYLVITDREDNILAHTFTTGFPKGFAPVPLDEVAEDDRFNSMRVGSHRVFHLAVPVKEGIYTIGTVQMGLDSAHIDNLIARLRLIFMSFLSLVTMLFFFLSHRLALNITRPVTSLIRYTDRLTRGDFNFSTHSDSAAPPLESGQKGDEITILSDSFMRMTRELARSTDRLRQSRKNYRSLFHSGPNPIFVVHREKFEILDANPKATEVFGYSREELRGKTLFDLGKLDPKTFDRDYPPGESIVISSKVEAFGKDRATLFVNIHAGTAEYREMEVIIVAATDITELVEKDTQLIQASKMKSLEKMSVGIAHEINQPLNAIKMGSEYLAMMQERHQPVAPGDLTMVVGEISDQVSRASEIVDRLKRFARKADFSREVISLNDCARAVHKIIGRQIALQNIDFQLDLDEDLPMVLAHNNRLEQVIFNLVTNARDAVNERVEAGSDIRRGKITIATFTDRKTVVLHIKDNGTGIEPERIETIFDSFFTTKEMGEGLGLGLPIVQGIVRDYNGTISVESKVGEGAVFRLVFPAHGAGNVPDKENR